MHIFFSVGEPSGDQHAAELIQELRERSPGIRITGFGGPRMDRAGCKLLYPLTDLAVMGILRVLPLLWTFYKLVQQADRYLAAERPDAVVLIDVPGFNWWIARKAKQHGIPVFYYMPPQLWAWAPWRVKKVKRFVDYIISGLSFEVEWYRQRGVNCEFVGHPFFDEVERHQLDRSFMATLRTKGEQVVGLLPGSRKQEVTGNFPCMLKVARRLHRSRPGTRFHVACYKESQRRMCAEMLDAAVERDPLMAGVPITLAVGRTSEIIAEADCCLMVSGSVSLELLARRTPAVVLYHASRRLMFLSWLMQTCEFVTLPNLMASREIMPEFVFSGSIDVPSEQMAMILGRWLTSEVDRQRVVRDLDELAKDVAQPGGTARTAGYVLEQLTPTLTRRAA